jgi:hypothetical protein
MDGLYHSANKLLTTDKLFDVKKATEWFRFVSFQVFAFCTDHEFLRAVIEKTTANIPLHEAVARTAAYGTRFDIASKSQVVPFCVSEKSKLHQTTVFNNQQKLMETLLLREEKHVRPSFPSPTQKELVVCVGPSVNRPSLAELKAIIGLSPVINDGLFVDLNDIYDEVIPTQGMARNRDTVGRIIITLAFHGVTIVLTTTGGSLTLQDGRHVKDVAREALGEDIHVTTVVLNSPSLIDVSKDVKYTRRGWMNANNIREDDDLRNYVTMRLCAIYHHAASTFVSSSSDGDTEEEREKSKPWDRRSTFDERTERVDHCEKAALSAIQNLLDTHRVAFSDDPECMSQLASDISQRERNIYRKDKDAKLTSILASYFLYRSCMEFHITVHHYGVSRGIPAPFDLTKYLDPGHRRDAVFCFSLAIPDVASFYLPVHDEYWPARTHSTIGTGSSGFPPQYVHALAMLASGVKPSDIPVDVALPTVVQTLVYAVNAALLPKNKSLAEVIEFVRQVRSELKTSMPGGRGAVNIPYWKGECRTIAEVKRDVRNRVIEEEEEKARKKNLLTAKGERDVDGSSFFLEHKSRPHVHARVNEAQKKEITKDGPLRSLAQASASSASKKVSDMAERIMGVRYEARVAVFHITPVLNV